MKFKDITRAAKGLVSKAAWKARKHAPEGLMILGAIGVIAGVVEACRETPKAMAAIEEHKTKMEVVHQCAETGKTVVGEEYTEDDVRMDTVRVYAQTGLKLAKIYAPAAIIIGTSITGMVWSNVILHKRLNLAMTAYAALATRFDEYRARVRDRVGAEDEKKLYHNVRAVEMTETSLDGEGNEVTTTKTIEVADDDDYSAIFTKFNPDGTINRAWEDDIEQNLYFLQIEQSYVNNELRAHPGKPIFLNQVRKRLHLPPTQVGQVVGWVYDPQNKLPNHHGDNFIDFGINDIVKAYRNGDEVPGEQGIVLSFNVDGNVMYAL